MGRTRGICVGVVLAVTCPMAMADFKRLPVYTETGDQKLPDMYGNIAVWAAHRSLGTS